MTYVPASQRGYAVPTKPVGNYVPAAQRGYSGDTTDVGKFLTSLAGVESGGRYDALGPVINSGMYKGDRAYGKYQVMGKNVPSWTKQYLGTSMTPQQFLRDTAAQDRLMRARAQELYNKYGNWNDVASVHFTGQPAKIGATKKDQLGTTGAQYVSNVSQGMKQPFDATPLGIAANTLKGLPKATLQVGKNIAQGFARSTAAAGAAISGIPEHVRALATNTPVKPGTGTFTPQGKIQQAIYGTNQPISFGTEGAFPGIGIRQNTPLAFAIGAAFSILDVTPFGGPKNAARAVVATKTAQDAAKLADTFRLPPDMRQLFIETAPKITDATAAERYLKNLDETLKTTRAQGTPPSNMVAGDIPAPNTTRGIWTGTKSSNGSDAPANPNVRTSTNNAPTGKEGVSAQRADTSGPFEEGTKLYRLTPENVHEPFRPAKIAGTKDQYGVHFFDNPKPTTDPIRTSRFGRQVNEAQVTGKIANIGDNPTPEIADIVNRPINELVPLLKERGFAGLKMGHEVVVFDPKNIRPSSPSIPQELEPLAALGFPDPKTITPIKLNGKIVGGIDATPTKYGDPQTLKIHHIRITREAQGKGLGKQAIAQLFKDNPNVNRLVGNATAESKPFWQKLATQFTGSDNNIFTIERTDFFNRLKGGTPKGDHPFDGGGKRPPSADRILGKEPNRQITKDEGVLLRDRIRAEARGAKMAAKDIRAEVRRRRELLKSIQEHFHMSDGDLRRLLKGRDHRFMSQDEFQRFLQDVDADAANQTAIAHRRALVRAQIHEKELVKVDNFRRAMAFPPIEQMSFRQLAQFDTLLSQFKHGDEFLGKRQLDTIKNTDLKGIHTIREAREALAKDMGVPVAQLDTIKVSEFDRYSYDTALARTNPFYDLLVQEKNKAFLTAEAEFYAIRTMLNDTINAARQSRPRSVLQRAIPTDQRIFSWLEADAAGKAKLAQDMTPQELHAADLVQRLYADARDYLIKQQVLKRYISDYITHIRRGFLEAWKDDGLITAFKEAFQKYKQDEAMFNILNSRTGEILPLEKFFQFSMRRTGELEPTKNVAKAVQAYFQAFTKKKALDAIVPKLDIYAHSLTPKQLTPKGLEFDNSLKRFVREWVNSKKGRVVDTVLVKPGGAVDWTLRTTIALTRLIDLGVSVPVGIAANIGEQIASLHALGAKQYALGVSRLATKQGRAITEKYKNFVGETLFERLADPSNGITDQLLTGAFSLYAAASRHANQVFLLASMTADEFAAGTIAVERLARLQTQMGRSRVVENFESIIGKTALGKVGTQYRAWAVPILLSTIDDVSKVVAMIGKGDPKLLSSPEFHELLRTVIISGTLGFALYGFIQEQKDNKDRSFIEELAFKAARDSLTLIGALDPSIWTATPRLLDFMNDLSTAAKQIVLIEESQKGLEKLKDSVTPRALSQFDGAQSDEDSDDPDLPDFPELPELPELPEPPEFPELPSL